MSRLIRSKATQEQSEEVPEDQEPEEVQSEEGSSSDSPDEQEDREEQEVQEVQEEEESTKDPPTKKKRPRKSKNREATMTLLEGNRYKDANGVVFRKYVRITPSGSKCTQFVKEVHGVCKKYDAFNHIFKSDIINLIKKVKPDKKSIAKIRLAVLKVLEEIIIEQEN